MEGAGARRSADHGVSRAAIILGNDAILAARPSTTAQLAHACGAAGFDIIVPPSWGDELVARAILDRLPAHTENAVAACACDRVRQLLARASTAGLPELAQLSLVAPPVAAARFLRLFYGDALLVTYVGDCPSAADPAIDARFSPTGFLASLHRQGISLDTQPNVASDVEANRWRRYESMPGGLPARRYLARAPIDRVIREIDATGSASAQPASRVNVVLDFTPAAGCFCAAHRGHLEETEPPRSSVPIVVAPGTLDLSPEPSSPRGRYTLRARRDSELVRTELPPAPDPSRLTQAPPAATPATGLRTAAREPNVVPAAQQPVRAPRDARRATNQPDADQRPNHRWIVTLLVLPAVVLGAAAAVGTAVYKGSSSGSVGSPPPVADQRTPEPSGHSDSAVPADTATTPVQDSAVARAAADSGARPPAPQAPRRRTPEVVPGWLPQGQRTFTPVDTTAGRRADSSTRPVRPDTTPPT